MTAAAEPVWHPSAERVEGANLTAFRTFLRQRGTVSLGDFSELYRWSVDSPEDFWASIWDFCGVVAHCPQGRRPWESVLDDPHKMPGARWFEGARLNFAENLLRFRDERPALVFWNERGRQRELSYADLYRAVARLARALRASGVGPGDRVAGFLPNMPEAVIAMLAAASLGALWSSCSPDFGIKGVLDRFGQIEPKVLFAADGYQWAGKPIDSLERVAGIVGELPSVERVVIVPYPEATGRDPGELPVLDSIPNALLWGEFTTPEPSEEGTGEIEFASLPFDHPLYIMYSSGTTGLPKCMVHGAGGTLLQHLKELVLHTDLRRQDRVYYYTTCGWMMWNWLVSGLAVGATVVLYDGSPFHARKESQWDLAAGEKLTVFGTSAKFLALSEKEGLRPARTHDLSALRTVLSTGSPLAPESYDYVYEEIKDDLCLASISGGTDLISCFALGNPVAPVYRGQLQALGLGMKVEVFDADGQSLLGQAGELVCTQAFPSMPVAFWNDPDGSRYRAAYFERFPGIWCHGDWVERTPEGGLIVYGRSDATLNPGGVRIGTAEIYRQVEQLEEILESLVVGQDWDGDVRVVLFVRLRPGLTLDDALIDHIRRHIRANATPRHVPAKVVQVADIPRTISGKISELAVRNILHDRPVTNTDALANPESLDLYRNLPELAR